MTCTTWETLANFSIFPRAKRLLDNACSEHGRDDVGCNSINSSYSVQICGTKRIAPIGKFVNSGLLYTAVYPAGQVIMVEVCDRYGGLMQCFSSSSTCRLGQLTGCSYTTVPTPYGVFVQDYKMETFVATTAKKGKFERHPFANDKRSRLGYFALERALRFFPPEFVGTLPELRIRKIIESQIFI
uniref:Uncharacterized protein n=1 Tax=Caenorhabditis japonica TaxID=281687 RepID=A0A8R1E155_CAEJA